MVAKLSDYSARPCKTPNSEKWVLTADIVIGGTGAVSSVDGDAGISASRSGTGTYDLVYPACVRASVHVELVSPLKTVVTKVVTAKSATAGTAEIKTLAGTNAAANTDPASGDILTVTIVGQPYSV
jgi:hypothetical protein